MFAHDYVQKVSFRGLRDRREEKEPIRLDHFDTIMKKLPLAVDVFNYLGTANDVVEIAGILKIFRLGNYVVNRNILIIDSFRKSI